MPRTAIVPVMLDRAELVSRLPGDATFLTKDRANR
jgi:hypothetical protein